MKIRKIHWTWLKKPEHVGATLMLLFGLGFMFALTPLNTPDEANHFLRVYQIAQGDFTGQPNSKEGCLSEWKDSINTDPKLRTFLVPKSIAEFAVSDRSNYDVSAQFKVALNESEQVRVCARQTSSNSPVGYIPQVIGITLGRIIHASPILIDYFARFAVLVTWTICLFFAIRISPVRKWAIVAIAALPIAVQQSISIGADAVSIAPAVLFMALLVRSYYIERTKDAKNDLLMLSALASIASLAKPVMIFLAFLIPLYIVHGRFVLASRVWRSKEAFKVLGAVATPLFLYAVWNGIAGATGVSVTDIFGLAAEKMTLLATSPLSLLHTFLRQAYYYIAGGASLDQYGSFGWFSYTLPMLWTFMGISILVLTLVLNYETRQAIIKRSRGLIYLRVAIFVVAALIFFANIASLFLIWTPLSSSAVQGMQFRYHLASLFLLAFVALGGRKNVTETWYRNLVLTSSCIVFVVSLLTIAG